MTFRKNRKFKEKPTIFAFGHIMLPLVGILALGLLVLGIRLLFVTPESNITYQEIPEPTSTAKIPDPVLPETLEKTKPDTIIAIPVQEDPEADGTTVKGDKKDPQEVPKSVAEPTPNEVIQKTGPSASVQTGVWVVQIGAFTLKDSADSLALEVRGKNFEPFVSRAEVGGKTYYRVRISAGSERSDAEALAKDLASKGYPTLVTRHE